MLRMPCPAGVVAVIDQRLVQDLEARQEAGLGDDGSRLRHEVRQQGHRRVDDRVEGGIGDLAVEEERVEEVDRLHDGVGRERQRPGCRAGDHERSAARRGRGRRAEEEPVHVGHLRVHASGRRAESVCSSGSAAANPSSRLVRHQTTTPSSTPLHVRKGLPEHPRRNLAEPPRVARRELHVARRRPRARRAGGRGRRRPGPPRFPAWSPAPRAR